MAGMDDASTPLTVGSKEEFRTATQASARLRIAERIWFLEQLEPESFDFICARGSSPMIGCAAGDGHPA